LITIPWVCEFVGQNEKFLHLPTFSQESLIFSLQRSVLFIKMPNLSVTIGKEAISMYAVIQTGGKQYRVEKGDVIKIEKLDGETGQPVDFDEVLMVSDGESQKLGTPIVAGAKVVGEILEQARDKKIFILKFKRRKHHMKRQGHRQYYTAVRITDIEGLGDK
jgi:large subunit ribosomal protein L21